MPEEDWADPTVDFFLVFGDRSIVRPPVSYMSEIEWLCEEQQRVARAAGGD